MSKWLKEFGNDLVDPQYYINAGKLAAETGDTAMSWSPAIAMLNPGLGAGVAL